MWTEDVSNLEFNEIMGSFFLVSPTEEKDVSSFAGNSCVSEEVTGDAACAVRALVMTSASVYGEFTLAFRCRTGRFVCTARTFGGVTDRHAGGESAVMYAVGGLVHDLVYHVEVTVGKWRPGDVVGDTEVVVVVNSGSSDLTGGLSRVLLRRLVFLIVRWLILRSRGLRVRCCWRLSMLGLLLMGGRVRLMLRLSLLMFRQFLSGVLMMSVV